MGDEDKTTTPVVDGDQAAVVSDDDKTAMPSADGDQTATPVAGVEPDVKEGGIMPAAEPTEAPADDDEDEEKPAVQPADGTDKPEEAL